MITFTTLLLHEENDASTFSLARHRYQQHPIAATMHVTVYIAIASTAHLSHTVPAEPAITTYQRNPARSSLNGAMCFWSLVGPG